MSALDPDDAEIVGRRQSPKEVLRKSLVTGAAIILPLAVTLLVLSFVVNFLSNALSPISQTAVSQLPFNNENIVRAITVVVLLVVMLVVGFLAEFTEGGSSIGNRFDHFMESIPGIGSVYTSFNEMSELLLDSDTESFQDVKLVQYPVEGSYTVAFKTADTPATLESDTGHDEMITLFMPMAPNPVMGGFVIHVSTDRVVDTDMTVEEGIRSIVTSGVAIGETSPTMRGLSEEQLEELGRLRRVEDGSQPESTGSVDASRDKQAQYERDVAPEFSDTPDKIERRTEGAGSDASTPADLERGEGSIGDTAGTPAEASRADERTRGTTPQPPAERAGHRRGDSAGSADVPDDIADDRDAGDDPGGSGDRNGGDAGEGKTTEGDTGGEETTEGGTDGDADGGESESESDEVFPTDSDEWTDEEDP
ncbi:DUF502 domain-containing protein [Haloglomus halophilum]|uniref:DUF502 domain-containing protein n=1 Tax=Haloglomus halophilum TaxID=2962672 RepID=UPI0020C93EB2|nr:DUF502 domain-containing protein [Haloglomus halophilum]